MFEEGKRAANVLVDYFSEKNGVLNILEIRGTDGSSAAEERYDGFRTVINNNEKFSIIESYTGDFLKSRGKELAQNIMAEQFKNTKSLTVNNKPIHILFFHNDGMMLGFLEVLDKHKINTGTSIVVVSIDQ